MGRLSPRNEIAMTITSTTTANRRLARTIRERARRTGEPYTKAREAVLEILEYMDSAGEDDFTVGEAWYDDPSRALLCGTCGWTVGMVCPECSTGCGCSYTCTGWRHAEFNAGADDDPEVHRADCEECGGFYDTRHGSNGYDCTC